MLRFPSEDRWEDGPEEVRRLDTLLAARQQADEIQADTYRIMRQLWELMQHHWRTQT